MLYIEIIAVISEIHTIHINTLCGQNVELLTVILAVRIVTTRPSELSSEAVQTDPTPPHTRNLTSFLTVAVPFSPVRTRRYINASLFRCDAVLFGRERTVFRRYQLSSTNQQGVTSGKL